MSSLSEAVGVEGVSAVLAAAIDSQETSFTVQPGGGVFPASAFQVKIDNEIMLVGSQAGGVFSGVSRAQEGTAAWPHPPGAPVLLVVGGEAIAAGGGGGSSAFVGSRVTLSGSLPGWFGNAVPFDVVNYDTDGFWDGGQSKMVVPAGKDGIYQVSFLLGLNADVAITSFIAFVESDDPDISSGVDYVGVKYDGSGNWLASGSCPQKLVAGNTVFLDGGVNGAADATINHSLAFFAISYLGPLT